MDKAAGLVPDCLPSGLAPHQWTSGDEGGFLLGSQRTACPKKSAPVQAVGGAVRCGLLSNLYSTVDRLLVPLAGTHHVEGCLLLL